MEQSVTHTHHPASPLIRDALKTFTDRVFGSFRIMPLFFDIAKYFELNAATQRAIFLDRHGERFSEKPGMVRVREEHQHFYRSVVQSHSDASSVTRSLPNATIVSLVSELDVLVSKLIRIHLTTHPEALSSSERTLTYREILAIENLQEAKDAMISREVELIMRDSHDRQFAWLEKHLKIKVKDELSCWGELIELTERRNLIVHTDCVVSSTYLKNLSSLGVSPTPGNSVGSVLAVTPEYFIQSVHVLLEAGAVIAQNVWRKLAKNDTRLADASLISVTFDMLSLELYRSTSAILKRFLSHKSLLSTSQNRLICQVNLAQSLKWSGDNDGCRECLSDIDDSALAPKFRLAKAVLDDRFSDAIEIVRAIGTSCEVARDDYVNWPLFKELRTKAEFLELFFKIFGRHMDEIRAEIAEISKNVTADAEKTAKLRIGEAMKPSSTPDPRDTSVNVGTIGDGGEGRNPTA
jgi:hypothetical protein